MKKSQINVSLIIPSYNEESVIEECLKHAIDQELPFFEIIVVDNNSTDTTAAIASKYPVRIVKESDQGIIYARDAGFNAAKGDVFARIDVDTHLPKNWNKLLVEYLNQNPNDQAVTGPCIFYDFPFKGLTKRIHTLLYYYGQKTITQIWPFWGSNMALRRSAWDKLLLSEYSQNVPGHEDIALSIQLSKLGIKTHYIAKLVATVSLRRGDLSFSNNVHYLLKMPATYFVHKWYVRSVVLYLATLLGIVLALPFWAALFIFKRFFLRASN